MKRHLVSEEDPQLVSVIPPSVAEETVDFEPFAADVVSKH